MNNSVDEIKIGERAVGGLPISVATSLAIESLIGQHPEIKVDKPPIQGDTREVWINIRTLVRNLLGALDNNFAKMVMPTPVGWAVAKEIEVIDSVINKVGNGMVRAVYYYPTYKSLHKLFPKATIKEPVTATQIHMRTMEDDVYRWLMAFVGGVDVRTIDVDIIGKHPKSFILTHYPVDLLSKNSFSGLRLIESHTGAIKSSLEWNTKLTNGKELLNIPFNRLTLQVFGDSGTLFSPKSMAHKQMIKDLADKNNWNTTTTRDRMLMNIRALPASDIKADLMQML